MVAELPLVGLADECERVRQAVGKGQSLLLLGPPGCGKTKVLRSVLRESCVRSVYLDAAPVPHDLLVGLGQALIDLGHSPLQRFVPAGEQVRPWLVAQTSLRLRGILWSAIEAEPITIALDQIGKAGASTYRFLQKAYYTRGVSIIAVSRKSSDLGFLSRLFWDPRETVSFRSLGERDALRLFDMLVDKFGLDALDLNDFRPRVLEAARGNPGQIVEMCRLAAKPSYQRGRHILFAPLRIDTVAHFAA
jgi:GTPase SAR1 family protein